MNEARNWLASHSLIPLLAIATVFVFVWLFHFRKQLHLRWYSALLAALLHTAWGVGCVKVFAFAESGFDPASAGNMSLFGGVFFMPVFYFLLAKVTKTKVTDSFDICTICMTFTLMCARINCVISGCCRGFPIPGTNGMRFPTREAEIVFYLILLVVLCPKIWKEKLQGQAYPVYMMCYGAFRFIIEFFRESDANSLFHRGHLWAIITLLLGVSIYAEMKTSKTTSRRRKQS